MPIFNFYIHLSNSQQVSPLRCYFLHIRSVALKYHVLVCAQDDLWVSRFQDQSLFSTHSFLFHEPVKLFTYYIFSWRVIIVWNMTQEVAGNQYKKRVIIITLRFYLYLSNYKHVLLLRCYFSSYLSLYFEIIIDVWRK